MVLLTKPNEKIGCVIMKTMMIQLSSIDDVKRFVNAAALLTCEADLSSGRYIVDAKSIMGIFSLDLSKPIKLELHCNNEDCCKGFLDKIAPFIIKN